MRVRNPKTNLKRRTSLLSRAAGATALPRATASIFCQAEELERRVFLSSTLRALPFAAIDLVNEQRLVKPPKHTPTNKPKVKPTASGSTGGGAVSGGSLTVSGAIAESEPNNTPGTADVVPITADPTIVSASMGYGDTDYFTFTLPSRSGVFFDTESREAGLSTILDTRLTLFGADGTSFIAQNDDGRDFDTLSLRETLDTPLEFGDSALYADLAAGTYVLQVFSWANPGDPVDPYQLKVTANSSFTSTVPAFNSRPGAADTLYLDFDGHSASDAWGTYSISPFDFNGNGSEWSPGERAAIETTWRVVSDLLSPFDVNVSTNYTGAYNDGQAHRQVIGNSDGHEVGATGALGVSWVGGYSGGGPTFKTGFTFASNFSDNYIDAGISGQIVSNAIEIANTSAHEFGHTLGLQHYLDDAHNSAIMYTPDFGLNRERWSSGTNSQGAAQNDVSVIASATNTFGYRPDDVGAGGLTLSPTGNTYATSGVIHQITDTDIFRFNGSGATTITLDIPEHVGHLDGRIELRDASNTLLASNDGVNKLSAKISFNLPSAGTYTVIVGSHGGESEVGQYSLNITTAPTGGGGTISGRTFKDSNYNGIYETALGDTIQSGVVVFIDGNGNATFDAGEQNTASAVDGTYSFTGLAAGTYNVYEVAPSGHINTQVYSRVVTAAGETYANTDFGNFPIVYTGGGGNDSYTVRLKNGDSTKIEILDSATPGVVWTAPKTLIPGITILGNAGDDALIVDYSFGNPVPASSGGILFNAGSTATVNPGNNVSIIGTSGADSINLNTVGQTGANTIATLAVRRCTVNGAGGTDTLNYGSTPADDTIAMSTTGWTDGILTGVYNSVENVVVNAGFGFDTLSVAHGSGAPAVTLNGGDGNDVLTITGALGTTTPITFNGDNDSDSVIINTSAAATFTYNGGSGSDSLNQSGTSVQDTVTINTTQVQGGASSTTYSSLESIVFNGIGLNDTFNVTALASTTAVTLNGGDGNDTFNIGSSLVFQGLNNILGGVTINGEVGTGDVVTLIDQTDLLTRDYTITPTTFARSSSFGTLSYGTIEGLTLNASANVNNINIAGTAAATPVTVNGNDGNDVLTISAAASAPVTFNGGTSTSFIDRLNVNAGSYTFNADARNTTARLILSANGIGTSVLLNATQHFEAVLVQQHAMMTLAANGSRLINTGTLLLGTEGTLDLKDNDLIVRSGSVGTASAFVYDGITGYIQSAYDFGGWDTPGLTTTMADASAGLTTLGIARASDVLFIDDTQTEIYNGETVNGSAVIVKYTYAADANLDGVVDGGDYGVIDNFVQVPGASGFFNGDFNFDGVMDGGDYGVIDNNIQAQGPGL